MVSHLFYYQLALLALIWLLAMAAGLTDHVWSLREVLLCRVPPWPQPHAR